MSSGPARRAVTSVRVCAIDGDSVRDRPDKVVTEEPMEIRLHGPGQEPSALTVTMRTPGNDFELAVGHCFAEGLLHSAAELDTVAYCLAGAGEQEYNIVTVKVRHPVDLGGSRGTLVGNASCGPGGSATLDEVAQHCEPVGAGPTVAWSVIASLPVRLRSAPTVFDVTGGVHAAARFTADGELIARREDVDREHALDKLVGHALLDGDLPLSDDVLMLPGQVSFETVRKAAMAGVPVLCAASAPSSLAIDAARRCGQTLVGFVRGETANVYTHPERLDLER